MAVFTIPGQVRLLFSGHLAMRLNDFGLVEITIGAQEDGRPPAAAPVLTLGPLELACVIGALCDMHDQLAEELTRAYDDMLDGDAPPQPMPPSDTKH